MSNLAYLYDHGLGVKQDFKIAHELYLKSANVGEPQAMYNLGLMYGSGHLGEIDPINGCAWMFRAVKYSTGQTSIVRKPAADAAAYCERTLKSNDIIRAKDIANGWSPSSSSAGPA
jgi:TPR repeat protein